MTNGDGSHPPLKGALFPNLKRLTCSCLNSEFDLDAPKLIDLNLIVFPGASIHLERLSSLNRLEITLTPILYEGLESERQYPQITCALNLNLTELKIIGNQPSLAFIEPLLTHSPNLKLIELAYANVPDSILQELVRRFPQVRINILFKYEPPVDSERNRFRGAFGVRAPQTNQRVSCLDLVVCLRKIFY